MTQKMNFVKNVHISQFQNKIPNKKFIRFYGKEITINVPTMGDSITEGRILEWTKGN